MTKDTDVLLVGAGPIGLELAVALKRARVDYVHLEAGQIAHTISWYPRETRFFSSPDRIAIAGVPLATVDQSKATREEYLNYLRSVVLQYGLPVRTYERVESIKRDEDAGAFHVRTRKGEAHREYHANHVVMATGDMHRPRRVNIPGEDLPHVSHYFVDPHDYFQQDLLIVGGKNSAVEAALRCARIGARVTVSHRREWFNPESIKYWLLPEIESQIKSGAIRHLPETLPVEIQHDHAVLRSVDGKHETTVPTDFVLLLTGYEMDTTLLAAAGVELVGENRAPKHDPETMMTNVEGLYIAGTAAAGTQLRFRLFIENCHPHVTKIVRSITGEPPAEGLVNDAASRYELPEQ